jgi:hypothetical protein
MKRQDLLTQEEFMPKRINQKFATSKNRIRYYNNKANQYRHSVAYISKPLHTNIKILNELMKGKKEETFHKQFLFGKGYTIGINTHFEEYEGKAHFAIHNYILISLSNNQMKIIKYKP